MERDSLVVGNCVIGVVTLPVVDFFVVLDTVGINVVKLSYSAKVDESESDEEADGTVVVVAVVVVRTVSTSFITDALEIPILKIISRSQYQTLYIK